MKFSVKNLSKALKNEFSCIDIAYLFGSSRNGKVKEGSDIDIAVLIKNDILQLNSLIGLEIEVFLQKCFGYPAEVVILNKANSILKYQVISTGQRLFERNSEKRSISEL
jgi:predicted nucleotidyltransferase